VSPTVQGLSFCAPVWVCSIAFAISLYRKARIVRVTGFFISDSGVSTSNRLKGASGPQQRPLPLASPSRSMVTRAVWDLREGTSRQNMHSTAPAHSGRGCSKQRRLLNRPESAFPASSPCLLTTRLDGSLLIPKRRTACHTGVCLGPGRPTCGISAASPHIRDCNRAVRSVSSLMALPFPPSNPT